MVEQEPTTEPEEQAPEAQEEPPRPLLVLRDGLPPLTDSPAALAEACAAIGAGSGPVAIDAERASGYRYSSRAYLIQLRREGSGTWLVDPIPLETLAPLAEALEGTEWILHAATQDLPCLAEVGLRPGSLFDTELAGRLLGYPRVGLATLVETVVGKRMKKEHSAVDWSRRPLPEPWLEYAALDVEVLVELRDALAAQLVEAGKDEWARQEFEALLSFEFAARVDAWRRTSGMHRVRTRRGLAAVKGFHGRGAERYASRWVAALREAAALEEADLPARAPRTEGPPLPRAWADRDPVAARRLALARTALGEAAERHSLPVENMLTPDYLRRVLWTPPATRDAAALAAAVDAALHDLGARPWQVELTGPVITQAILGADEPPEPS